MNFYHDTAGREIAENFFKAVAKALDRIAINPYCGQLYVPPDDYEELNSLHYRRLNLRASSHFPFLVFYEIEVELVRVHLLYHQKQNLEKALMETFREPC